MLIREGACSDELQCSQRKVAPAEGVLKAESPIGWNLGHRAGVQLDQRALFKSLQREL